MKPQFAILCFVVGTLAMMLLYHSELLLFGLMVLASIVCLAIDKWKNLRMFLLAMLVGGICENIAVALGAWGYSNASYLFVPIWLPVGWGMSVVFLEEGFAKSMHAQIPKFSKKFLFLAFGGTIATGLAFQNEVGIFLSFCFVTVAMFAIGYYHRSEVKLGLMAAVFGTGMETLCILVGNWHYSAAMFGTPIWLPFCWFNAFLIMRRIVRFGE